MKTEAIGIEADRLFRARQHYRVESGQHESSFIAGANGRNASRLYRQVQKKD
ncbi:hypothetical protein ACFPFV_12500 [Salinicoccus siamensis]|uniref:hypothetical protein n=1 Tax=Salinicoccus siamensis TaxID=381830 RepID=UPI00361B5578